MKMKIIDYDIIYSFVVDSFDEDCELGRKHSDKNR